MQHLLNGKNLIDFTSLHQKGLHFLIRHIKLNTLRYLFCILQTLSIYVHPVHKREEKLSFE